MSLRELKSKLRFWQAQLGLKDYKIHLQWGKVVTDRDFDPRAGEISPDLAAHTTWTAEYPEAIITLAKGPDATEETLCHEILHIRLEAHRTAPMKYDPLYERALNELAKALVASQRGV